MMMLTILEYPETRSRYAMIICGHTQSIEGVTRRAALWSEAKAWFEDRTIPLSMGEDFMSCTLDPARFWHALITDPDHQFEMKMTFL